MVGKTRYGNEGEGAAPWPGRAPIEVRHAGRGLRLKWRQLRLGPADPPFARRNLRAGLAAGASLEVDLRRLACGRFVCLHDERLDSETSGRGRVAEADAAAIARLEMLGAAGQAPLLLDELVDIARSGPIDAAARVQLDLQASAAEIDLATGRAFATALGGLAAHFILSGYDWDAVRRLGGGVEGLALGYDPGEDPGVGDVAARVRDTAPEAEWIYLHRKLLRAPGGAGLVARLREAGHRVDCWTIDHGTPEAAADLRTALDAGCDQITTSTARAWATAKLEEEAG